MRTAIAFFLLVSLASGAVSSQPAAETHALTMQRMLSLAKLPRAEFVRRWDGLRDAEFARLAISGSAARAATPGANARLRLAFRHAQGRVMYPFFHWRETDAASIEQDPGLESVLARLPPIDGRMWESVEVREYVEARLHDLARRRLLVDPDLARGDARWLRAKMRSLSAVLPARDLWTRKAGELLLKHIEDDGAYGIDEPMGWWLARSPPADSVRKIDDAIEADRAHLRGVRSLRYREVTGVTLYLHVLEPARLRRTPRPAVLWLHGGSATEGTWWHSPVTTQSLLDEGVVVVAADLTTGNRFDRDADQITDASAAFDYLVSHADALGLDSGRIGVAGFSSGGSLALLLATRGAAPTAEGSGMSPRFARPAAAIVSGACADPLSQEEDGYFRKSMSRYGDPADFSPYAQLRTALPPVLAIHATADEFCSFSDMSKFVDRSRSLGNEVTLISVEGASHFFGFYHEVGQRQQRTGIVDALRRWGW